ncbi:MAG: HAD family hydrolase [Desulfobacterales bacterium]|jgi:2-phosphoglycolate phosphatase
MLLNHIKLDVDAVIFDLDGTIIDSIPIYFNLIDIVFQRLGLPLIPQKTIIEAVKDGDFNWDIVLPEARKGQKDELISGARTIIYEIYPDLFGKDLKLIPGAARALAEISENGKKIGIVTSTPMEGIAYKLRPLKRHGIEELFEVIITADDVQQKKPAAEPLIECVNLLGASLNKSVYVGDTRVDIRAGKAAGMKTIGVLTGFDDYETLKNESPDAIIDSVDQLPEAITL